MKFKLKQNSLEVAQNIINNHPEILEIRLLAHSVEKNWRQVFEDNKSKLFALANSIKHEKPLQENKYNRQDFLNLALNDLPNFNGNNVWSLCSRVLCANGKYKHIPMMNFHPEIVKKEDAIEPISQMIKLVCPKRLGVLLDSGRFYHFYGNFLLEPNEWIKFMAQFLMPCILVSPRYIGHRLHDGYCALRITDESEFKPDIPEVIQIIN